MIKVIANLSVRLRPVAVFFHFTQVFSFEEVHQEGNSVLNGKSKPPAECGTKIEGGLWVENITTSDLSVIE